MITESPDRIVLDHRPLQSASGYLRSEVLRRILRGVGWPEASMSARRWHRLAALCRRDKVPRVVVGAGVEVAMDGGRLVLRPVAESGAGTLAFGAAHEPIPLILAGRTLVPWADCQIEAQIDPTPEWPHDELVDFTRLAGPLCVRAHA